MKFPVHNGDIPDGPPPRTSHISFRASCSRLLFSALGMPSDGVMSPTIAVNKIRYE